LAAVPTVGGGLPGRRESPRDPGDSLTETGQEIQDLIDLAKRNNLAELEVEREGVRIRIRRDAAAGSQPVPVREVPAGEQDVRDETPAQAVPAEAAGYVTVTSPIVGTFYRSASPDADPYVEEGDVVKKGQVLCIVEAMKLMNEIESETDGRIIKILAESTKPVEYGQPLFLIDPKPAS
jgi:acetyl-CoA carboxylase biotin carboxyl carrier protein